MKKIVSVVACNALKLKTGEISRLAAYRVVEVERPESTFLLGLPGLDAEKNKNVYAVRHFPQVAIEGCDKRCATRVLQFWNVRHIKTLTVPEILDNARLNLEEITISPPNATCHEAIKRVAISAATAIDVFIADGPAAGTDHPSADAYICGACGWIYKPLEGDPDFGVVPGTAFNDLPDAWICAVCAVPADNFEPVDHG
ncbi:MAG: hypothetical protein GY850_41870 [bacterium]|nr:hypothetical protein [bacterium]